MKTENIIRAMKPYLKDEVIFFDENYAPNSSDRPLITFDEVDRWVDSVSITKDNKLQLYTEYIEGCEWETLILSAETLAKMDEEQVYWLLHEMWYELPYECDITEMEDKFNELTKCADDMKTYCIDMDVTFSARMYVEARDIESAKKLAEERMNADPYYHTRNRVWVETEVTDAYEED